MPRMFLLPISFPKTLALLAVLGINLEHATFANDSLPPPTRVRAFSEVYLHGTPSTDPAKPVKGVILIRDGLIFAVGPDVAIPSGAQLTVAREMHAYPSFIDAGNTSLLGEAQAPSAPARPQGLDETGLAHLPPDLRTRFTPEFRGLTVLQNAGPAYSTRREAGFGIAHALPTGRLCSGQSLTLLTNDRPQRENVLHDFTAMVFDFTGRGGFDYPSTTMGHMALFRQVWLDAARHQLHQSLMASNSALPRPAFDAGWDALNQTKRQKKAVVFVADKKDDIDRMLRIAAEYELLPVILGASEATRSIEELKAAKARVIVDINFGEAPAEGKLLGSLDPARKTPVRVQNDVRDRFFARVDLLKTLKENGIPAAVSLRGLDKPETVWTNLRLMTSRGLSAADLQAALTTTPAEILGVSDVLGTLAPGRVAAVTILTGPLTEAGAKVRYVALRDDLHEYHRGDAAMDSGNKAATGTVGSPAGRWKLTIAGGEKAEPAVLELVQQDNKLTGHFESDHGQGRVTKGTTKEGSIDVTVSIGAGDRAVTLKFTGKVSGDELAGDLVPALGAKTTFTGQRLPPEAGPPQLSLAEDNDIRPASAATPDNKANEPKTAAVPEKDIPAGDKKDIKAPADWPSELLADRRRKTAATNGNLLVKGGTVLTALGPALENHDVLIREGKIASVGRNLAPDDGMTVIDAAGQFVMPGMIDTHSHMMFGGVGGVNEATNSITCEVRVRDVVMNEDPEEYRWLALGLTTARLLHGSANTIGGQDVVLQMRVGDSVPQHYFSGARQGVKFALGENVKRRSGRFPNTRMGVEAIITRGFVEALEYRKSWMDYDAAVKRGEKNLLPPRKDLRLEALQEILNGSILIHSHCYRSDEILMLLRAAESHGIRVQSLQHVLEGYKIAPEIAKHGASADTFADHWAYKIEAYDATPYTMAILYQAGINVVVKSDFPVVPHALNHEAAKALRYGNVPPDAALQFITRNSARSLGIDDQVGTIEVGKRGDLAIYNTHPLSGFSRCEKTIIGGEIYFDRHGQPAVMSEQAAAKSERLPAPKWVPSKERRRPIDFPADMPAKFALVNARIVRVDQPVIEKGSVVIENGRITAVGEDVPGLESVAKIDLTGLEVSPGIIDSGTMVGISEISQLGVTSDFADTGVFQPDLMAATAINPDSEHIATARAGGVTRALLRLEGGRIGGQVSLIQLAGWTSQEMTIHPTAGLQIEWPPGEKTDQAIRDLKAVFVAARQYDAAAKAEGNPAGLIKDLRYEALRPYVNGEKRLFIEANLYRELVDAIKFADEEKLKIVITGGVEAWRVAGELASRQIPVLVGPVIRRPVHDWDPYDACYANPGRLVEAGVKIAFRSTEASDCRNVPFHAATAVAFGLPEETALRCITLTAAEILGMDGDVGSVTPGKIADLVISDGSTLQQGTQIKGVLIGGKPVPLTSRQTRFAEKYLQRVTTEGPNGFRAQVP